MTFSSHSSQHSTHFLEDNGNSLQTLILKQIEQQHLSHTQILIAMGYQLHQSSQSNLQPYKTLKHNKALRRLAQVLSSPYLGLTKPSYDFKYSTTEFIQVLCQVLGIAQAEYQPLLQPLKQYADKVLHAVKPVVYADIHFNDNFTPSFFNTMAVSKYTHVPLADGIRLLDREQQLQVIYQQIKQHHAKLQDSIPFDGVIKGYRVLLTDENGVERGATHTLYIAADF
ncbi:hypothetical protein [Psychrobacter sp. I-STPA10]|uniref:hypothetical protein n=1 Tax=Psychrobacter sp. I-STPA10 TaxID=2585769 RepID=UPI001E6404C6|nr:hypothetical protein [Psychrobacter sp. I-STPA10]